MKKKHMVLFLLLLVFGFLYFLFLSSCMTGSAGITYDFGQEGYAQIQKKIGYYGKVFGIWPNEYKLDSGNTIRVEFSVLNNDSREHFFVVNVYPKKVSSNICPSGDVNICLMPDGKKIKTYLEKWISIDRNPVKLKENALWQGSFLLKTSDEIGKGNYTFEVVACYDTESKNCFNGSETLWGKPEEIKLTVS